MKEMTKATARQFVMSKESTKTARRAPSLTPTKNNKDMGQPRKGNTLR